jgi:hypothetical protein
MGGREHIRIETVQDAFCCFLSNNLFLIHFKVTSQEVLKVPKAPTRATPQLMLDRGET